MFSLSSSKKSDEDGDDVWLASGTKSRRLLRTELGYDIKTLNEAFYVKKLANKVRNS